MKNRVFLPLLITGLTLVLMAGCGNKAEDNMSEETASTLRTEKSDTLRVWGAEEDGELLAKLCEDFKAENPDCDLNIVIEPMSEGDCKGALLGDVKNAPDVFTFADDQLQTYVAAGVIDEVPDANVKNANVEGSVLASTINDKLYAYPMTADNGYFMYYDKRVFSESDLESLDKMIAKATEAEKQIFVDLGSGWYIYTFFGNTGLEVGLNDDGISNYCTWNSAENDIKGTEVLSAMIEICSSPAITADNGLVAGAQSGNVCAGISGVWDANSLMEIWGDNLGATKLPTYTVAGKQVQMASFCGFKLIGVNAYSDNKDWAHKLANYLTNEKSQLARFNMRALGPSNINAANSPEVSASVALQAVLAQAPFAELQRIGGNYWGPAGDVGNLAKDGNSREVDLQQFLDSVVESITKKY